MARRFYRLRRHQIFHRVPIDKERLDAERNRKPRRPQLGIEQVGSELVDECLLDPRGAFRRLSVIDSTTTRRPPGFNS